MIKLLVCFVDLIKDFVDLLFLLFVVILNICKFGFEFVGVICGEWLCFGENGFFVFLKGLGLNFKVFVVK